MGDTNGISTSSDKSKIGLYIGIGLATFLVLGFIGFILNSYFLKSSDITITIDNGTKSTDGKTITCNTGYKLNATGDKCISSTTTGGTTSGGTTQGGTTSGGTTTGGTTTGGTTTGGTTTGGTTSGGTTSGGTTSGGTTTGETSSGGTTSDGTTTPEGTPELDCYNKDRVKYSYIYDNNVCKTCKEYLKITNYSDDVYNGMKFNDTKNCVINSCPTTHSLDTTKNKCIIKCTPGQIPSDDGTTCGNCGNNDNVESWNPNTI
jgi:hypothetical protein